MFSNRITSFTMEPEPIHLPLSAAPAFSPAAFALCPFPVCSAAQWTAQQWLYQRAFEVAQAVVRPSILERDLLGVWN
jgi:hypothetical protein